MKILKIILINLIILGSLIAGLEYFVAVIFFRDDNSRENTKLDALKEKAYAELADEFKQYKLKKSCPKQKILTKNTDGSFVRYENQDWSCAGISVKDNKRVTTDQPSFFERKVHLFGGSTVFGFGSTDYFTIHLYCKKNLMKKITKLKL